MRERTITIDMDEGNYRILRYKQYDDNNILKVAIQENKQEVNLSTYTARFFFQLPSDTILEKDAIIEDNKIVVSLDSGTLSESGRIITEIVLSNANQIVSAFKMYLDVESSIDRNEAIQSKPEWDIISDTLSNVDNKVDKVEGKSLIADSEILRLSTVNNYDDTELRNLIETKSEFNGDYNNLINKPNIPTTTSDLTNDSGYATETYVNNALNTIDLTDYQTKEDLTLNTVDKTIVGAINELDLSTIKFEDIDDSILDVDASILNRISTLEDSNHTHTNKDILDTITIEKITEWNNKSNFSGDYNDLINKPIIPTLDGYATQNYVKNAIADAQLGGTGTVDIDLSGYATKDELNAKANVTDIPTNVSQLANDSGYLTSIPTEYVTETELTSKGYATNTDLNNKVDKVIGKSLIADTEITRLVNMEDNANNYVHPSTHPATMIVEDNTHRFTTDLEKANWNAKADANHTHTELHTHDNKDILDTITDLKIAEWDGKSNFDGDYNSLINTPTIPTMPTNTSQLINDSGYATETYVSNKIAEAQLGGEVDLSNYATLTDLSTKVDKITGKNLSTEDYTTEEKNKLANLSTVATSGSYTDLINQPTIPSLDGYATEIYVENAIANAQLSGGEGESVDLSIYQTKSDITLTTDAKTVVGAINELDIECIKAVNYSTIDATIGNDVSNRLTNLETNKADISYVDNAIANIDMSGDIDLSIYQTKSDNTLTTTDKTVVGAINELKALNSEENVQADWNEVDATSDAYIKNKPDLTLYVTKTDNTLITTDKTIVGAINELFQNVSSGKELIATAITDKGVTTSSDDTFQTMADNIGLIETNGDNISLPSWYEESLKDKWISISASTQRCGLTASSIGDNIYAIGGYFDDYLNQNYKYNTQENTWTSMTVMPTAEAYLTSQSINDKIYCMGGYNGDTNGLNQCYDATTNTWSSKTAYDIGYHLTSSKINNKIYVIGGFSLSAIRNYNYCYDPSTDTWTTKTNMTTARYKCSASSVSNNIYVIGGTTSSQTYSQVVECYDSLTNTWSTKTNVSYPVVGLSSESIGEKIYAFGGISTSTVYSMSTYCYNTSTDTWEEVYTMNSRRAYFGSAVVNNNIYSICGETTSSNKLNTSEFYIPN